MIIVKDDSVHFKVFSPAIMTMLNCLYSLNLQQIPEFPSDFIITSANDSTSHSAKSKHYINKALDLRSKNFTTKIAKLNFMVKMKMMLGDDFTILLESENKPNEHFHIQVKKGL